MIRIGVFRSRTGRRTGLRATGREQPNRENRGDESKFLIHRSLHLILRQPQTEQARTFPIRRLCSASVVRELNDDPRVNQAQEIITSRAKISMTNHPAKQQAISMWKLMRFAQQ
jgi:hypothetical protein